MSWLSKLSDNVGFLWLGRWFVKQPFKISNTLYLLYFWIKITSVGMHFLSLNKRNNLLPNLFDFAEIFLFAHLPLILHAQIREKPFLKIFGDGMWEKESIIDVQCWQENPNPRAYCLSGKPTGMVDTRVGIFPSPMNTNEWFYLSGIAIYRNIHFAKGRYYFKFKWLNYHNIIKTC